MKRLSVITVNYGTPDLTIDCVEAIAATRSPDDEISIIVVDGGSSDNSVEIIAKRLAASHLKDWVELLPLPINGGFAFANNRAMMLLAQQGDLPDYIALINPDAQVTPGALEALRATLDREPKAGAVGALLIHQDGRPQGSAFWFPTLRGEFCQGARTGVIDRLLRHKSEPIVAAKACQVPWVTGAAVMFRTAALQSTGLFDEGFFLYFEETELMWRMRKAGWQIWHEPAARVIHLGGAATKIRDPETGLPLPKRMPRYWYEARRKYFALTGGPGHALSAGLAWLSGYGIWQLRRRITNLPDDGPLSPASDLAKFGLWPPKMIAKPAAPYFKTEANPEPHWMETRP
ncbi:glycosyltransferase family 2 protein [Novosphingobium sp.]|uniref:glycosyltransferase family 2 protein n=1 Tax=Novosphingobium sp. TaxID=1874826 RepID=UPI003B52FB55